MIEKLIKHWLILLWLGINFMFFSYAFIDVGELGLKHNTASIASITNCSFGIGITTCFTLALFLIRSVHRNKIGRLLALILGAVSAGFSIVLPFLLMSMADRFLFESRLFHGESGLVLVAVAVDSLYWNGFLFCLFVISALCVRKRAALVEVGQNETAVNPARGT